jgi:hypothetical protein
VEYHVDPDNLGVFRPFRPWMACVELSCHLLRVRSRWITTPWQLYSYLMKHGGIIRRARS